jgi:hypothetical protein
MPLTGIEGDLSPRGARGDREKLERGWRKAAKVVCDSGKLELLIERSQILRSLSNSSWTPRRIFVLEPLDSYSPRIPSPAFSATKEHFESLLGGS